MMDKSAAQYLAEQGHYDQKELQMLLSWLEALTLSELFWLKQQYEGILSAQPEGEKH